MFYVDELSTNPSISILNRNLGKCNRLLVISVSVYPENDVVDIVNKAKKVAND